ncbi:MAG: nickel pincer cofactor biosynthesis protein LarC [Lachnospiraceae bacterium]|nr:nickel pincer cofactor biosynthesis protein LarC [Lachnospiraceae bacterium]
MKILYLDCGMGAAGDMLTAALTELLPNPDEFIVKLNSLSIPGVQFSKETAVKCGITGTHISVLVDGAEENEEMHEYSHEHEHSNEHEYHHKHEHSHEHEHHHEHEHSHEHHHSGMHDIEHIVSHLDISTKVKEDVLAVYNLIAEAESHVHGRPVTEIHFHEVGTMDAIADVTAVCMLMDELSPNEVIVSPVHVGSGQVKCAHGILPVPAPATAYILRDVPIYGGSIQGELCTPTGAALLKHFADRFGDMPVMRTQAIGYGMGKKDFPRANCVRAMLGETADKTDTVSELSCNVDDMTAEAIGFATERLFEGGANEVYTIPIGMKKSRPGTLIRVICKEQDKEKMVGLLFRHTSTIGVRETVTQRYILERKIESVQTPYGKVRRKVSSGYGTSRIKYEYDDLARIAKEQNISIDEVRKLVEKI